MNKHEAVMYSAATLQMGLIRPAGLIQSVGKKGPIFLTAAI